MADGIDAAGHAAHYNQSTDGQIAAEAFRHLRSIESRTSGSYDAEAGEVEDLRVAANVEQDGRVINL